MAQNARATRTDWKGFPEVLAIALAGLTAFAAAEHSTDRAYCSAPVLANFERQTAPVERTPNMDAMLRDMRLHD